MLTGRLKTKAVLDSRHQRVQRYGECLGVCGRVGGVAECADRMREGRALSGTKSL